MYPIGIDYFRQRKQGPFFTNQRQSLDSSSHHPSSTTDLSNMNTEVESNASSPGMPRVRKH